MKNLKLLSIIFVLALNSPISSQSQEHFYDFFKFGQDFNSTKPASYFNNGNYLLLPGKDAQLYVSDGTAAGTTLLKVVSSDPTILANGFVAYGRFTYFSIYPKSTGREIWVTDGTAAGTKRIHQSAVKYPQVSYQVFNGSCFYTFSVDDKTFEMRSMDTTAFKDTLLGKYKYDYQSLFTTYATTDSFIYFTYEDTIYRIGKDMKRETFWKTSSAYTGSIRSFKSSNNILFWYIEDFASNLISFYVSKGTVATTKKITNYTFTDDLIVDIERMGNYLFFLANRDLYKLDMNTLAVTKLTNTISYKVYSYTTDLVAYNNRLYFQVGVFQKTQLWSTNAANTDIQVFATISNDTAATLYNFRVVNNVMLFNAYTRANGRELWKCQGTAATTSMLIDIVPGPGSSITGYYPDYFGQFAYTPAVFKNQLVFAASNAAYGSEPWISDGTATGTKLLKDINNTFNYGDQEAGAFMIAGDYLFLRANDSLNGAELWRTDGSQSGTQLVHNITPSYLPTDFSDHIAYKNNLVVTALSLVEGEELYTSNGKTGAANSFYVTPSSLFSSSSPRDYAIMEPYLYYIGTSGGKNNLFRTDASNIKANTFILNKGVSNSFSDPDGLRKIGGKLYFSAVLPNVGREPLVSDGTLAGTVLLKDMNPGAAASNPKFFCGKDSIFFTALDAGGNYGVYQSDGTASLTYKSFDFNMLNFLNIQADTMFYHNGKVFLRLMYNGNSFAKTTMLASWDARTNALTILQPLSGENYSDPKEMTLIGNQILFSAKGASSSVELWVTDGSRAGTKLLKDIMTGSTGSNPAHLTAYNGLVYFSAADAAHGREVWVSNGQASGTRLLWDIEAGTGHGNPTAFIGYKGYVYMAANQGTRTQSLFRIQADSCQAFALRLRNNNNFDKICENKAASLFVESGFDNSHIKWYRNDSLLSFVNDTIKVAQGGTYYVTIDSNNCHNRSNDLKITVQPKFETRIKYEKDSVFCDGGSLNMLQTTPNISSRWFRNGTLTITGNTFNTTGAAKFYVVGMDDFGCTDTSNSLSPVKYPKPLPLITRRNDTLFCSINADSFQWVLNNVAINGAKNKFIKLQAYGKYNVEAYSVQRCKGVSNIYNHYSQSVETVNTSRVFLYPNPVHDKLMIDIQDVNKLTVTDATGKILMVQQGELNMLDVSGLAAGIYMVAVETGTGLYTSTFVKAD